MTAAILKSGPERPGPRRRKSQFKGVTPVIKKVKQSPLPNAYTRSITDSVHGSDHCAGIRRESPQGGIKPRYGREKQRASQQTVRLHPRAGSSTWGPLTVRATQPGTYTSLS